MRIIRKLPLVFILLGLFAISLTACESPKTTTINFYVDDTVYSTVQATQNSSISLPPDPLKDGYTFEGWYLDNTNLEKPFTPENLSQLQGGESLSVFAVFKPVADLYVYPNKDAGGNVYNTITDALNASEPNQKIFVSAGVYQEKLVIDKPVTLLGNNYDISADGTRREETILTIKDDIGKDIYTYLTSDNSIITVTSTDVVVKGITIDGDNPQIENIWSEERHAELFGTGVITEGTSKYYSSEYLKEFFGKDLGIDASIGIYSDYSADKTLIIENNIVKNLWQFGLHIYQSSLDTIISGNRLENIPFLGTHYKGNYWGSYGVGILFADGANGKIENNSISDCQSAIQVQTSSPISAVINSNSLENCNTGIWLNSIRKAPIQLSVKNNIISYKEGKTYFRPDYNYGIAISAITKLSSASLDGSVLIDQNIIEGYNYGVALAQIDQEAGLSITNNTFNNISEACLGHLNIVLGYTLTGNVYLTLENNNYFDNTKLVITSTGTAFITENGETTEHKLF